MTLLTLRKRAQNLSHMQHRPARFAALLFLSACAQFAWGQVPTLVVKPKAQAVAPAVKSQGPATIDAQSIEGVSELELTARGAVEFQRDDVTVYSDLLRFHQEFGRIEAEGGVRFLRGDDRFFGPRLRYNTQDDTGVFEGSNYILGGKNSTMRGNAERLEFLGKDRLRLVQGSLTSCEPGKEDWRFEARELEIDNDKQLGTIRDGRLKFFDTTILPLPDGSFSLDNQRKSGFLVPSYSQNSRRGLELTAPYYWNIAPELDLTLTPAVMSKRGEQLRSEFRYIDRTYAGSLRYEILPHDDAFGASRSAIALLHQQQITPQLFGRLDLNRVSDDRYFVDLTSRVRQVSTGLLRQMGSLSYHSEEAGAGLARSGTPGAELSRVPGGESYRSEVPGAGFYFDAMVQRWQTLQDPLATIIPPYARLPQFRFGTTTNDIAGRFDLALPAEYTRFSYPTLIGGTRPVEGTRLAFNPVLAAPILAPGYFVTPKVGLHYTNYRLTNTDLGQPERQNLSLPWMSIDSGLVFDRGVNWFGQPLTQTLEPRLYYVYVPYRNQSQNPLFDTALKDLNSSQIFSENRFVGNDRFGDANQVTLAASSRILAPAGQEMLRATIGQRYYLSDERVRLDPNTTLRSKGDSELLASLGGRVAGNFSFDSALQYNPQQSRAERYSVSARYAPEIAKVVNASYRYNRDTRLKQIDLTGQWPMGTGWYAVGRWNYSVSDSRLLEGIAGVEYNAGCWVFRGAYQRIQAAVQTASTGIFFQLEFNGVGGVGFNDVVNMLKRTVPGYAVTNPTEGSLVPQSLRPQLPFEQIF